MQPSCESREISHTCISGLCPELLNAGHAEGKLIIKQGSGKLLRMEFICERTECDLLMSTNLHIKPLFFSSLETSRQHVKKLIFQGFSAISVFPLWHILLSKGQKSKAFMCTRGRKDWHDFLPYFFWFTSVILSSHGCLVSGCPFGFLQEKGYPTSLTGILGPFCWRSGCPLDIFAMKHGFQLATQQRANNKDGLLLRLSDVSVEAVRKESW